MDGKVCVVTGATSGIGKAMALEFARRGARVVAVAHSEERGAGPFAELKAIAKHEPVLEVADLAHMREVRALAERLRRRFDRIDVLMNNAGLYLPRRRVTREGLEVTFAVNHLAPFLLTNLLHDRLAAGQARVVVTTSVAFRSAHLDFDDLMMEKGAWRGLRQYANAKLGTVLFTRECARRFAADGIRINCFHPGGTRSGMAQGEPNWIGTMWRTFGFLLRTEAKGADTGVYLATAPEMADVSGQYFMDRKVRELTAAARDDVLAARMWDLSAELTGLKRGDRGQRGTINETTGARS